MQKSLVITKPKCKLSDRVKKGSLYIIIRAKKSHPGSEERVENFFVFKKNFSFGEETPRFGREEGILP